MTVRAVTALVPEGPGLRYWSDHSYDALIDDTLTPTVWDEDEPAATTARGARRIHFQNVAAGTDMAGATARSSWGCASGHNGTGPSIPGCSPPEPSPRGGGLVPSNVRSRSADTPSGS